VLCVHARCHVSTIAHFVCWPTANAVVNFAARTDMGEKGVSAVSVARCVQSRCLAVRTRLSAMQRRPYA